MAQGDKARQSELMMRAASSGHSAVQDARNQVLAQHRAGAQQTDQRAGMVGGMFERQAEREQQGEQFNQQMEQRRSETELRAVESGFEPNTKGDDRLAKLDKEMQRGADQPQIGPLETEAQNRLRVQGEKPMEQDTSSGRWRPTAERQAATKMKQDLEGYKAETERMRARAYQQQVAGSYNRNMLQGNKEQAKQDYETLTKPLNQQAEMFNSFMNNKMTDAQWTKLQMEAKEAGQFDPALGEAIKSVRNGNPDAPIGKGGETAAQRVTQFMRGRMSAMALSHIEQTGRFDGLDIDWNTPQMIEFKNMQTYASGLAQQMGPEFSQFIQINSIADKNQFLNRQAAIFVKYGMAQVAKADVSGEGFVTGNEAGGLGQPLSQGGPEEVMGTAQAPQKPNPNDPAYLRQLAESQGQNFDQMVSESRPDMNSGDPNRRLRDSLGMGVNSGLPQLRR